MLQTDWRRHNAVCVIIRYNLGVQKFPVVYHNVFIPAKRPRWCVTMYSPLQMTPVVCHNVLTPAKGSCGMSQCTHPPRRCLWCVTMYSPLQKAPVALRLQPANLHIHPSNHHGPSMPHSTHDSSWKAESIAILYTQHVINILMHEQWHTLQWLAL